MGFKYPASQIWEDAIFTQICCKFAKSIVCIDKIVFSYWMNYNSCLHKRGSVDKYLEHYKAECFAQSIYNANGLSYDFDRIIISLIAESLKMISVEHSFIFVKQLLERHEFALLKSDVEPWKYLQKDIRLWRRNSYLAYIKNRVEFFPPLFIKKCLISFPVMRPFAEYLQYHVIEKWCDA